MNSQKKLIQRKNCIENLSNKIFYEIFDYLDGFDIYKAFSNLNHRLENLLNNSSFFIKIHLSSISSFDYEYEQFIYLKKNQILSLHFNNQQILERFMRSFYIDLFHYVQSIVLNSISTYQLAVSFVDLVTVSSLSSLTIHLNDYCDNLHEFFQVIFRLPVLKYLKIELFSYTSNIFKPMFRDQRVSSIKYLIINAACPHNQLIDLLSYTPQLIHLSWNYLFSSNHHIKLEMKMKLNHLEYLNIFINDMNFSQFEEFLLKICTQLNYLNVTINSSDKNYLDADRWERLISQKMISLNKFIFSYTNNIHDNPSHLFNEFTSQFWLNRKWIFKRIIHDENKLIYSIRL